MAGGRTERGSRRRARAASVVVPFPRGEAGNRLDLARLLPSGRSLFLGFVLAIAVFGGYWGAKASSVFAVQHLEVQGASPAVAREVEKAAQGVVGTSLIDIDARAIEDTVRALPSVAGVSVDRAFPNTLIVKVAAERPVAVIRRGNSAWLATGSGKVIQAIETGTERQFPRLWLTRVVGVRIGGSLPSTLAAATRALAAAREVRLPRRVKAVRSGEGKLTLILHDGPEIRLGGASDVLLKLTVAARVFPLLDERSLYVDVSVPERPIASRYLNS
ncbi:MAG: FtsQ-type POTRA domain-containing protein [Actinobacteria bacterium]|nr:FtsQ-type POTRA domain-containing protein [Actinomycetota bacterium]